MHKKNASRDVKTPEVVLTEKEQEIKTYVEHLKDKSEHGYITWTDLHGIVEMLENKTWLPGDCERDTDNDNKCLSKLKHLCKKCINGICTYE